MSVAITEPQAGSDVAGITTSAVKEVFFFFFFFGKNCPPSAKTKFRVAKKRYLLMRRGCTIKDIEKKCQKKNLKLLCGFILAFVLCLSRSLSLSLLACVCGCRKKLEVD